MTPLVERGAPDAEPLADFDNTHGIAVHEGSVSKVLTPGKGCEHNTYMTNTTANKCHGHALDLTPGSVPHRCTNFCTDNDCCKDDDEGNEFALNAEGWR